MRTGLDDYALVEQIANQAGVAGAIGDELFATLIYTLDSAPLDHNLLDITLFHIRDKLRIGKLRRGNLRRAKIVKHRHQDDGNHHP